MSSTLTAGCGSCGVVTGGGKKIRRKTTKKRKNGCGCKNNFGFFNGFIKNKRRSTLRSKNRSNSQKGGFIPSKKNISKRIHTKNTPFLNTNQKKISKQAGGVFGAVPPFTTNSHSFANVPYNSYNNIGSLENPTNTRILGGTTNPTTESTNTVPPNNTSLLSKYTTVLNNTGVPSPILV